MIELPEAPIQVPAFGAGGRVPGYVPILKGRLGEFTAIEHAEEPVRRLIRHISR